MMQLLLKNTRNQKKIHQKDFSHKTRIRLIVVILIYVLNDQIQIIKKFHTQLLEKQTSYFIIK